MFGAALEVVHAGILEGILAAHLHLVRVLNAGAGLEADHALGHEVVAVAPDAEGLVILDHGLGQLVKIQQLVVAVDFPEGMELLFPVRDAEAAAAEEIHEAIPEAGIVQCLLEEARVGGVAGVELQVAFVLHAGVELQGPELGALEARGGLEAVAEFQELRGAHGFHDVHLLDEHPRDLDAAAQEPVGGARLALLQVQDGGAGLVQEELEPELVDLVDDDELHLVVGLGLAQRLLQAQKSMDLEVALIGRLGGGHGESVSGSPHGEALEAPFGLGSGGVERREKFDGTPLGLAPLVGRLPKVTGRQGFREAILRSQGPAFDGL